MRFRYITSLSLLLFILTGLTVYATRRAVHGDAEPMSLRLQWLNQAQFAGFYVARDKGFYRDEQINLDIEPGGSGINVPMMVAAGQADVGIWQGDQVLRAVGAQHLPIRAVGVVFRSSLDCFLVRDDSNIFSPFDFRGKTVGIYNGFSSETIYLDLLRKFHIDADSVHRIPAAYSLTPFLEGKADVWPAFVINEPLDAAEQNIKTRCLAPADYGIKYYSDTIIVSDSTLAKRKDLVIRFLRASNRGWRYAIAHPNETTDIVMKYGHDLDRQHQRAMLEALSPYLNPTDPTFQIDPLVWRSMAISLQTSGAIPSAKDLSHVADFDIAREATN